MSNGISGIFIPILSRFQSGIENLSQIRIREIYGKRIMERELCPPLVHTIKFKSFHRRTKIVKERLDKTDLIYLGADVTRIIV